MNPISSFVTYLRSSKAELEKVSWPTRQETLRYSALVLAVSVVMAAFFATLDIGLNQIVSSVLVSRSLESPANEPVAPDTTPDTSPAALPDLKPQIEAVDASGAPAEVKVEKLPLDNK